MPSAIPCPIAAKKVRTPDFGFSVSPDSLCCSNLSIPENVWARPWAGEGGPSAGIGTARAFAAGEGVLFSAEGIAGGPSATSREDINEPHIPKNPKAATAIKNPANSLRTSSGREWIRRKILYTVYAIFSTTTAVLASSGMSFFLSVSFSTGSGLDTPISLRNGSTPARFALTPGNL